MAKNIISIFKHFEHQTRSKSSQISTINSQNYLHKRTAVTAHIESNEKRQILGDVFPSFAGSGLASSPSSLIFIGSSLAFSLLCILGSRCHCHRAFSFASHSINNEKRSHQPSSQSIFRSNINYLKKIKK